MSDTVITALLVAIPATLVAIGTLIQTIRTHRAVNSRMEELLALTREASRAEGKIEERKDVKDAADKALGKP
jgi:cytochrome c-type biogenesis protein CcmH/NrfF